MMIAEKYMRRSRLFRRLKNGSHGQLIERYAARLVKDGHAQQGTLRSLRLVGDFLNWIASSRSMLTTSMNVWSISFAVGITAKTCWTIAKPYFSR